MFCKKYMLHFFLFKPLSSNISFSYFLIAAILICAKNLPLNGKKERAIGK